MSKKDFLSLQDYSASEINDILSKSMFFKRAVKSKLDIPQDLKGKHVLLLFEKPSTRTRISMCVAVSMLGGAPIPVDKSSLQASRGETLKDTALVLSRYVDAIAARVKDHNSLLELSKHASIPVINMLSDKFHPLQALADAMTILENKGLKKDLIIVFVGDGSANTCHSLMIVCSKLGFRFRVACPEGYKPDEKILNSALSNCKSSGASISIFLDPKEAVQDADVIYTDTWFSMGVTDIERRKKVFPPYQVNSELLSYAKKDVIVLHCQPWFLGQEITEDVAYGPHSKAFDQAENRLYTSMAVLSKLLK